MPRPFRIWLYPLPAFIALVGWLFIFVTTDVQVIAFGLGLLRSGWWRSRCGRGGRMSGDSRLAKS